MSLRYVTTACRTRTLVAALTVLLAALGVRLLGASDAPMIPDEYYTILAARSYAAEGVPRIGGGEYVRAPAFTALVASSLTLFGDSLLAARLPSIVTSALVVMIAFLWLRREAGPAAGWLLALLLALSASAIGVAQFSRFYALHALLYLVCAFATYELLKPLAEHAAWRGREGWRRVLLAAIGLACVLAAAYLQDITIIGLIALAVWAATIVIARPSLRSRAVRWLTPSALLVAAVGLIAAAILVDLPARLAALYDSYRWAALWAVENQDRARFYVHGLARELPLLLYTFPIAVVIALARAPRPAFFCIAVCAVALLLHSFAGMKAMRYIQYIWPLLLAPWAIAGAELLHAVARAATAVVQRTASAWPGLARLRPAAAGSMAAAAGGIAVAAAVTVALAGNPDLQLVKTLPVVVAAAFDAGPVAREARERRREEQRAVAAIRELVEQPGPFITSSDLLALWHVGRFDYELRAGRLREFKPGREFDRDPRTGAIVISEPASLARVMACHPAGTLVIWPQDWRRPARVPPAAADYIEAHMQAVPLPGTYGARAFRWDDSTARNVFCPPPLARQGRAATARPTPP